MPVTFDFPLSVTIPGLGGAGDGLSLEGPGLSLGLGSFFFGSLGSFSSSDFLGSSTVIVTDGAFASFCWSASRVDADKICSEGPLGVGEIGFWRFLSSSLVIYKLLDGDSGSSIWITWSCDSAFFWGDGGFSVLAGTAVEAPAASLGGAVVCLASSVLPSEPEILNNQ